MQRLLASFVFVGVSLVLNAQHREIFVTDTDAMRANARKHTEMVHEAAVLSAEQTAQVNELYMQVERQVDGMNQRMAMAGMSEADKKVEMVPHWASLDRMVASRLQQILTPEQYAKWDEASK